MAQTGLEIGRATTSLAEAGSSGWTGRRAWGAVPGARLVKRQRRQWYQFHHRKHPVLGPANYAPFPWQRKLAPQFENLNYNRTNHAVYSGRSGLIEKSDRAIPREFRTRGPGGAYEETGVCNA
jgi:hypothetical protein